ncbi:hypothetical protein IWX50DRAFT_615938 [Phyllosticta citricarpa]|uniref:Uncharacterized protein n=1 Tax=Phyllosticta citricarpa TaxID=55181 RepID=A0ABR1MD03_9PEZI
MHSTTRNSKHFLPVKPSIYPSVRPSVVVNAVNQSISQRSQSVRSESLVRKRRTGGVRSGKRNGGRNSASVSIFEFEFESGVEGAQTAQCAGSDGNPSEPESDFLSPLFAFAASLAAAAAAAVSLCFSSQSPSLNPNPVAPHPIPTPRPRFCSFPCERAAFGGATRQLASKSSRVESSRGNESMYVDVGRKSESKTKSIAPLRQNDRTTDRQTVESQCVAVVSSSDSSMYATVTRNRGENRDDDPTRSKNKKTLKLPKEGKETPPAHARARARHSPGSHARGRQGDEQTNEQQTGGNMGKIMNT